MLSRKLAISLLVLAAAATVVATRGMAPPTPNPPGTFSFAVLGDAPYYVLHGEALRYRLVLRELDAHDLSFIIHVGDIFWRPCSDERYRQTLDEFNALRHPVIYTPGDNEWADCWTEATGSFEPLGRLARIRDAFFTEPGQSLGGRRIAVVSQRGSHEFSEFVENVRWSHQGIVFATVNLPGSKNAREAFPGRTSAHDQASQRRTDAATAWLREAFAHAQATGAAAVVVNFHADPGLEAPVTNEYRRAYEPFLTALEEESDQFGRPVLVTHGDNHEFKIDTPLVGRTAGRRLERLTRLEVPGSPDVGWVRVVVTPGSTPTFAFEPRIVPRWKHW